MRIRRDAPGKRGHPFLRASFFVPGMLKFILENGILEVPHKAGKGSGRMKERKPLQGCGRHMAAKFYAVRKGRKTGIFRTWDECRASVHGFSGPEYKSFGTLEEAQTFLQGVQKEEVEEDRLRIYVDGSFHAGTGEFSYGMVVLLKEGIQTFHKKYDDKELAAMHNVAGEIKGQRRPCVMPWSMGSERLPFTMIMRELPSGVLDCGRRTKREPEPTSLSMMRPADRLIPFVKVAGHSGDTYKEMADQLAKEALGI